VICKYCKGKGYKVIPGVLMTKQTLEKHGFDEKPKDGTSWNFCICDMGRTMEDEFLRGKISVDINGMDVWFEFFEAPFSTHIQSKTPKSMGKAEPYRVGGPAGAKSGLMGFIASKLAVIWH